MTRPIEGERLLRPVLRDGVRLADGRIGLEEAARVRPAQP